MVRGDVFSPREQTDRELLCPRNVLLTAVGSKTVYQENELRDTREHTAQRNPFP